MTEKEHDLAAVSEENILLNQEGVKFNENQANNQSLTQEDQENLKETEKFAQQQIKQYQQIKELYASGKWSEAYQLKLKELEFSLQIEKEAPTGRGDELKRLFNRDILKYQELQKLNIKEELDNQETQGFTYLYRVLKSFFPILFLVVLCFSLTTVFTDRFFLDLDRSKLYPGSTLFKTFERIVFAFMLAFIIYGVVIILAFLSASLLSGWGTLQYPMVVEIGEKTVLFTVGSLLWKTILLQLLAMAVVVLMIDLISKLVKKLMPTLFISLVVLIAPPLLIGKVEFFNQVATFLPQTYFNAGQVVTQTLAESCRNPNITFLNGIIVLLLCVIILGLLACCMDRKGGENNSFSKEDTRSQK
ncbi:hypothetical protein [Listeria floridensis]|nr:hypothetical protein [Listeria floridensis]